MKHILFKIQRMVAVTEIEAKAFGIVTFLLLVGMGVRYTQAHWPIPEPPPNVPRAQQPIFDAGTQATTALSLYADTLKNPADSTISRMDERSTIPQDTQCVNLNSASALELQSLAGIGPKLAQRILDFRSNNGLFTTEAELLRVKGIGQKTFERLKLLICV